MEPPPHSPGGNAEGDCGPLWAEGVAATHRSHHASAGVIAEAPYSVRLEAKDICFSRRRHGFESRTEYNLEARGAPLKLEVCR